MTVWALRSLLAFVALSVLVGCAAPMPIKTYEGKQLPVEDIAILMVDRQTFVRDIAGYKTGITFTNKDMAMEGTQFEVKPGPQQIVFDFYSYSSSSDNVAAPTGTVPVTTTHKSMFTLVPIKISHDFQKGHKYELHYRSEDKKIHAQIVDVTDGGAKRGYAVAWGRL